MKTEHVKIKNWQVCCNDFMMACINDSIELNYNEDAMKLKGTANQITYCPFCRTEIQLKADSESA